MNHLRLRILSIAREAEAAQDSTSGTISSQTSSMSSLDAEEPLAAGRSLLLPAFTATSLYPVLSFDNADLQSLLTSERPNLVGNPYTGVCPNGSRVGTSSCWFNPNAFALPPPGQFGNAGRNILRGPAFAQFDLALLKTFQLREGTKIAIGAEAYNLFNHPNFAVPSNTQSPLTLGGNGDAVFKDAAGNFANNVGRIFTTVGTGRQIQLIARLTF